ncbi:hypothetical protein ACQ7B2_15660, partial [Escherichia coli]
GGIPDSELLSALAISMNRMVESPVVLGSSEQGPLVVAIARACALPTRRLCVGDFDGSAAIFRDSAQVPITP